MANHKNAFYSVVALVVIFLTVVCDALPIEVEVYRLIQYDIYGAPFGCRVASLNRYAASSISAPASDLSRTAVILYLRELYETENEHFMREYIEGGKPLGGLLILLPEGFRPYNPHTLPCDCDFTVEKKQLEALEQMLIHSTIQYPVYFAFEHQGLAKVLAGIRRNDAPDQPVATNGYKLVVTSPTPKKLASPTIINIHGWLPGLKADGDSNQLPTIAIVASYDTFGATPSLSVGSDSNGSGVLTLLAIARIFSILYSNPSTRGRYNILFGLTSGGPYNYAGTQKWLRGFDQRLRESIDYAICLNSLGSRTSGLWLHVSEPPENAYVKQIFEDLSNVAKELNVNVGVKHKKINVSNSRVAWEHEHFSRLKVPAATLSRLSVAPNLLENTGGVYDKREFVSVEELGHSVILVARSLARHIYGQEEKNMNIFSDRRSLLAIYQHMFMWLDVLSQTHRVAPFLSNDAAIITALKKELAQHVEVNDTYDVVDDGMFTFYDSTVNTLLIHQVTSVTHGLFWQLILIVYLITIFIFPVVAGVRMISLVYYVSLYLTKFMKNKET